MKTLRSVLTLLIGVGVLSGCVTVGPDYQRPELGLPAGYADLSELPGAAADDAATGPLVADRWWTAFGDPALDALVDHALAGNRDLAIAVARVDEARALAGVVAADRWPEVAVGTSAGRSKVSTSTTPLPPDRPAETDRFTLAGSVSYDLDLWGRLRRANEAARAELLATEEARRTVALAVAAEVVSAYLDLATATAQLAITGDTLATRRESVDLQQLRFDAGSISELDLAGAQAELYAAEATVPVVERQLRQTEQRLNVLLGRAGGRHQLTDRGGEAVVAGSSDEVSDPLATFVVPRVPVGLPSELLARRPDVAAAEQRLVAANARIGIARAALFPSIRLTGDLGSESADLGDLFGSGTSVWSAAMSLLQPVFNAGKLRRQVTAAEARERQAMWGYAKVVETAFAEVENALIARRTGAAERAALARQVEALTRSRRLAGLRYDAGDASFLELLDAERARFRAELELVRARRGELAAAVDLFRSLGGGFAQPAVAAPTE